MTAPERLAKVAEVTGWHQRLLDGPGSCQCGEWPPETHDVDWPTHLADAMAPLLGEFQAEDEARIKRAEEDANRAIDRRREETARAKAAETKAARVREAVEALAETWEAKRFYDVAAMQLRNSFTRDLRAALDAAEKENHDG